MEGKYSKLISKLFQRARQDSVYAEMNREYATMEEQFSQLVLRLSQEDQDLAWAFVFQGEAMNNRLLEILCEEMQVWRADLQ